MVEVILKGMVALPCFYHYVMPDVAEGCGIVT